MAHSSRTNRRTTVVPLVVLLLWACRLPGPSWLPFADRLNDWIQDRGAGPSHVMSRSEYGAMNDELASLRIRLQTARDREHQAQAAQATPCRWSWCCGAKRSRRGDRVLDPSDPYQWHGIWQQVLPDLVIAACAKA